MYNIRLFIFMLFLIVHCQAKLNHGWSDLQKILLNQKEIDAMIKIHLYIGSATLGSTIGLGISMGSYFNSLKNICLRQEAKIKKLKQRINDIHEQDMYAYNPTEGSDDT